MNKKIWFLLFLPVFVFSSCKSKSSSRVSGTVETKIEKKHVPEGLTIKQALKTVVTIRGFWVEKDLVFDDKSKWICSGVILDVSASGIHVVTNKHCLGLRELASADPGTAPEVKTWEIQVTTHNGKKLKAESVTVNSDFDLAVLTVRNPGLIKSRDYLPAPEIKAVNIGDYVIAVGSPLTQKLSGTITFGRVSALRKAFIQHDAAINPGNSGGALYVKTKDGTYCFAGINSSRMENKRIVGGRTITGIGFAIAAAYMDNGAKIKVSVNPAGACKLIRALYHKSCND